MRKIHFLIMLCLPLCLSIQAKAEPEGMLPAEKAEMKAGKMKEALDLNENQYKKLCRLFKKTEKSRKSSQRNSSSNGVSHYTRAGKNKNSAHTFQTFVISDKQTRGDVLRCPDISSFIFNMCRSGPRIR